MENDQATLTDQEIITPAPTMAETMRATFDSIKERDNVNTDDVEVEDKPLGKPRSPDGKFAKVEAEAEPVVIDPATNTESVETTPIAPVTPVAPTVNPPSGWTAEAKADWASASPKIQKEVLRREQDMHNGIAQYKEAATYAHSIQKAIQPFEHTIRSLGITPEAAVHALFDQENRLRNGSPQEKLNTIARLAQSYGVDLSQGVPQQQQIDPNLQYFQNQLQSTQQQLNQVLTANQQREQFELNSQIAAAKEGKPHFDELRHQIGTLLQASIDSGSPLTLDQAYESALWASPQHRQTLLAQQLADRQAADAKLKADQAQQVKAAAQAAKAASVTNVQRRGTLPGQKAIGSMQDTMRDTLEQIRSR